MKITSTYRGYSLEITSSEKENLYSATIPVQYGLVDLELKEKSIDCILHTHENVVDSYKNLSTDPETLYHYLDVEYQDYILKGYYNFNINKTEFWLIYIPKEKKELLRKDLTFTPSTNTQELIDQFINFVDSKK
jgi:hypothetical protein